MAKCKCWSCGDLSLCIHAFKYECKICKKMNYTKEAWKRAKAKATKIEEALSYCDIKQKLFENIVEFIDSKEIKLDLACATIKHPDVNDTICLEMTNAALKIMYRKLEFNDENKA